MNAVKSQKTDDAALVARALEGEDRAFDMLMQRHVPRCYRIARRFGLSPEDSADVVQESFIAAYRALASFDFSYQFSTWITRILLNRISNVRRGLARARRFFFRPPGEPLSAAMLERASPHDPAKRLEYLELQEQLGRALRRLKPAHRTVFILFELEGIKIREIAKMLDIPEGTVTSRLHYARRRMRAYLRRYLSDD